jgi:hypothetical protein
MKAAQRYRTLDLPFYRAEIAPMLPPRVLDFHAHTWTARNWRELPWTSRRKGGAYMVTQPDYTPAMLLADGRRCFPDRAYHAVCFGNPSPVSDWARDTAYVTAAARRHAPLFPLVIGGRELKIPRERYEQAFAVGGFYGFKVFLNWLGDHYGDKRVEEMIGPVEIALANERRLIVLLHVPRAGRLADPVVQRGVRWLSRECPEASIVLAHAGRCYMPAEMKAGIAAVKKLANVSLDLSMVMDPVVVQLALDAIGPGRLLFATDFPVAAMRGRRVRVMDHWVDVVLPGYPASAYRVAGAVRATFMAWEICLAIRWAAELAGLSRRDVHAIFWDNGRRRLAAVRRISASVAGLHHSCICGGKAHRNRPFPPYKQRMNLSEL